VVAAGRGPHRIRLCADDYGMAPGVNNAIRELLVRRRLNATSVMVVSRNFWPEEARSLSAVIAGGSAGVGLHLTLTFPFRPLTRFAPRHQDAFPKLADLLAMSLLRRLDRAALAAEVAAQLEAFGAAFGRPPDFVDGHQHVQLFPQIRDEVLLAMKRLAPHAWLRQCGSPARRAGRWIAADRKALLLELLSTAVRRRAREFAVAVNPAFAGTYHFGPHADFAALFPEFLRGMTAEGVIMCHPGFVDAELRRLDPLTDQREREYHYLASEAFLSALDAHGLTLA
jgi:predicted glycoside hydrolase/deacetylase ChbG (UPF0249 family)